MTLLDTFRNAIREPRGNVPLRTLRTHATVAFVLLFIRDVMAILYAAHSSPSPIGGIWSSVLMLMAFLVPSGFVWAVFQQLEPHLDRLEGRDDPTVLSPHDKMSTHLQKTQGGTGPCNGEVPASRSDAHWAAPESPSHLI